MSKSLYKQIGLVLLGMGLVIFCFSQLGMAKSVKKEAVKPEMEHKTETIKSEKEIYQGYIDFFEEVYKTLDENYYQAVNRDSFDAFIEKFNSKIYSQLKSENKSNDYIRWRSASFLVKHLKTDEDIFSEFYPPEPAKEYQASALGVRRDLGIEGKPTDGGYQVVKIEPRSDAYQKGLRLNDVITKIDQNVLKNLTEEKIKELLSPLADSMVKLSYMSVDQAAEKEIEVVSKEFFQQMLFIKDTAVAHIYCLELKHFNQKTSEDMFRFLQYFKSLGPVKGLILDLRGNPGGPPLAAREIASFFLPPGEEFAYFQKKGQPKSMLDVPAIPQEYRYDGAMVILIDEKSGSSSELFSGVLQKRKRAVLMGQNSAGQVMLKSMFHFDDESMVLLVTARGHHPDGSTFSFKGVVPERYVRPEEHLDLVEYATKYLVYTNIKEMKSNLKANTVN